MHPFYRLTAASLHGKASHTILSRPRAPYELCSLATPEGEILAALCIEMLMGGGDGSPRGVVPPHSGVARELDL